MKRGTLHYRVGLALVTLSIAFAALVTFILGGGVQTSMTYFIAFEENVKGMVVGSKVNFQGVPAGVVRDIRFRDGESLVQIAVAPDKCLVQEVTRARLDRLLVTGQVTVELEGFERGRSRLPASSFIATRQSPIGELTRSLPEVLAGLPSLLRQIEAVATGLAATLDPTTQQHLQSTVANLDAITTRLVPVADAAAGPLAEAMAAVPSVLVRVSAALEEMQCGIAELRALVAGDDARAALRDVAGVAARLDGLERGAEALVADLRSLVAGSRGNWTAALAGVRDAMRDVRGLARMLQLAPSSLIYGREVADLAAPPTGSK